VETPPKEERMTEKYGLKNYGKGGAGKSAGRSLPSQAERRSNVRWACSASVQILEPKSGTKIAARTTDLGFAGCYVDTINVLAVGTPLWVRITLANQAFETEAKVMYVLPGMGMGLVFTEMAPHDHAILQEWANELQRGSAPSWEIDVAKGAELPREKERKVVNQLIKLLLRKKILSEDEASSLLE
jgi:PilZ domain